MSSPSALPSTPPRSGELNIGDSIIYRRNNQPDVLLIVSSIKPTVIEWKDINSLLNDYTLSTEPLTDALASPNISLERFNDILKAVVTQILLKSIKNDDNIGKIEGKHKPLEDFREADLVRKPDVEVVKSILAVHYEDVLGGGDDGGAVKGG